MGDNDLVEQSRESVEDADVDSVAKQQQDVAPVFEEPDEGAKKFSRALIVAVVAATGLGGARWCRRLCLENYTNIIHREFFSMKNIIFLDVLKMLLTHD